MSRPARFASVLVVLLAATVGGLGGCAETSVTASSRLSGGASAGPLAGGGEGNTPQAPEKHAATRSDRDRWHTRASEARGARFEVDCRMCNRP